MSDSERSSRGDGSAGEFIFVKQSRNLTTYQIEIFDKAPLLIPEDLKIKNIDESECMKIRQRPTNTVFVLTNFDGECFLHLKSLLCCIVGPPLLISCIENEIPLPKSRTPMFSDHMKGVVVCCTNVDREKRDDIYELITRMGGKFKRDFELCCNYLIAGAVGSQKYEMAVQRNISIVTAEWAQEAWRFACSGQKFDPKSQEYLSKYKCKPFSGLQLTISGLRAEERKVAEREIQKNGGFYSGDMKMGETSHLITNSTQGAKYDAATKWNVKIVSIQWLLDCVERGVCLDEKLYSIGKGAAPTTSGQKVSTPTGAGVAAPRFSLLDPNCSVILRKDANCTEISTSVSPSATTYCVNETVEPSTAKRPSSSSTFVKPKNLSDRKQSSSTSRIDDSTSFFQLETSKKIRRSVSKSTFESSKDEQQNTPVEDLDLTITTVGDFLHSCRIYLNGFELKEIEKLKKIVNAGGGERSPTLNERVTHVVLAADVDKFVKDRLNSMKNKPAIVNVQWLVRSFKCGKLLPVKEFFHKDFGGPSDESESVTTKK